MNWLLNAIRALAPNCREAIRLQSDAMDRSLPLLQRIGLRFHLWICLWCRRYGKQIRFVHDAAHRCKEHADGAPVRAMPPEARERIRQAMGIGKK